MKRVFFLFFAIIMPLMAISSDITTFLGTWKCISSIDIVTKAKNDSTGEPFIIKFEGETDSSSGQLVEEQPVLGPDHVNQQAPAAVNNK